MEKPFKSVFDRNVFMKWKPSEKESSLAQYKSGVLNFYEQYPRDTINDIEIVDVISFADDYKGNTKTSKLYYLKNYLLYVSKLEPISERDKILSTLAGYDVAYGNEKNEPINQAKSFSFDELNKILARFQHSESLKEQKQLLVFLLMFLYKIDKNELVNVIVDKRNIITEKHNIPVSEISHLFTYDVKELLPNLTANAIYRNIKLYLASVLNCDKSRISQRVISKTHDELVVICPDCKKPKLNVHDNLIVSGQGIVICTDCAHSRL